MIEMQKVYIREVKVLISTGKKKIKQKIGKGNLFYFLF